MNLTCLPGRVFVAGMTRVAAAIPMTANQENGQL
jgi:hypothetical protein